MTFFVASIFAGFILTVTAWQGNPSICTPVPYSPGTTSGNAGGAPCKFPFVYKNQTYSKCIILDHNHLWCSTTGNYDKDQMYGNCPATTDSKGQGDTCVFPFKYNGAFFQKCIYKDHDKPWCGTVSDVDKEPTKWGECPDVTGYPLPPLPTTFSARVQWNDFLQSTSTYMEEYYDEDRNIGVFQVTGWLGPGVMSKYLSDYNEKMFYTIPDLQESLDGTETCVAESIDFGGSTFEFPFKDVNGTDTILGPLHILEFGEDFPLIYKGMDQLDSLPVEKWEACVYLPNMDKQTLHVTYYFTSNTTVNASPLEQVPVKQVLKGGDVKGKITYDQVYSWAYFGPELPTDPSIFETPIGQLCDGRPITKSLPSIPDAFSFRIETTDQDVDVNYMTTTSEWYDYKQNLTRMDYTPIFGRGENKYGFDPLITIHDFSDGISYVIDKKRRNCSIKAIPLEGFDDVASSFNVTRLRNPKEFFSLDMTPYYYEGKRWMRNILTDVYITERPWPYLNSATPAKWEWYFSDKDWFVINGDGTTPSYSIPVKLVVYPEDQTVAMQVLHFFDFTEESPGIETYDVSTCYRDGERKSYNIVLNGKFKGNVDRSIPIFRYMFAITIETVTNIRLLRVQDIVVSFDNQNHVFVHFTLLGPVLIPGDVGRVVPQIPLADAEKAITAWVNAGNFSVLMTMTWAENDMVYMTAMPNSFKEDKSERATPGPAVTITTSGYSGGSMAGIAIGMILLGLVLGALGVIAYQRVKARQYNAYKKDLDMRAVSGSITE